MVDQELLQAIGTMMDQKIAPLCTRMDRLEKEMQEVKADVQGLKAEMQEVKADVQGLKTDVQGLKAEMREVKDRVTKIEGRVTKIETKVTKIEATQELRVLPGISLLAEGHENILEHIQEKIDVRADKLEERVDALTIVVRYHSQDISELKKAQ